MNYFEEDYDGYSYEEDDLQRETFYALTDGMYGDYEDFLERGYDMDDLRDMLGM